MVRPVSRFGFAGALTVLLAVFSVFQLGSYEVDDRSTMAQCIERLTQRGRAECVISEPILATTRGSATITAPIFGGTLPTTRAIDLTIRFEDDGCLLWNHLSAAPQAGDPANTVMPVDILRVTAPDGLVAGSRLRIENACLRHLTDGVDGGQAANRIVGIAIRGDGAGNLASSLDFATTSLNGASTTWTNAIGLRVDGEAGGMSNGYATPATLEYLSRMLRFEGLDLSIPWGTYWIDPYRGNDANEGTYQQPFRTLGKWKAIASYGVRLMVKNAGRDRPPVFSNQTFPFPTGETCIVGETVSYSGGTSRILDIDYPAGIVVFETLTGNRIVATTAITSGSVNGANCSWTVGTRQPTIWDGTTYLCQTDSTRTCSAGNRYTSTGCTSPGAGICTASASAGIALKTTPTRYLGRVVTLLDAEDAALRYRIHGDGRTAGDLDGPGQATNSDRNGLFIARSDLSYGCVGIANAIVEKLAEDVISNHEEGCVRALNVYVDRVWNEANSINNNVLTTHGGSAGRGGAALINGGGVGWQYQSGVGATVAPTGSAHMIVLNGQFGVDFTNWAGGATAGSPFDGTGGKVSLVNVDTSCQSLATAVAGCFGYTFVSQDSASTFSAARIVARDAKNDATPAITLLSGGSALTAKFYRLGIRGGRGVQLQSFGTGLIDLEVKGGLFDDTNGPYIMDFSASSANVNATIDGVYDDDTAKYYFDWDTGTKSYNTAAAARAILPANWRFFAGDYSVLSAAAEYEAGTTGRCSQAAGTRCFDQYYEQWEMPFPVPLYDYLPTPIRGYTESGQRSYGGR